MKVLMICPELPRENNPGGMAPALRQFESLRQLGVEVDVVDMHGPRVLKYAMLLPQIRKRMHNANIVHAHYGFCGWLGRLQVSKPLVVSFMGSDINGDAGSTGKPRFASRIESFTNRRLLSRIASHIIVKSQAMADILPPGKVSVIANGVDTEKFQPMDCRAARQQLGWRQDGMIVLFPSNPQRINKGYALAKQVVASTSEAIGTAIELKPLWGVPPEDVPLYMNACNAMLLTSFAEGSPNVVKEAMACNTPIVAADVGDVGYLLSASTGNQVCARHAGAMTEALTRQLRCPTICSGRERILQLGLTLNGVANRILEVYRTLTTLQEAP